MPRYKEDRRSSYDNYSNLNDTASNSTNTKHDNYYNNDHNNKYSENTNQWNSSSVTPPNPTPPPYRNHYDQYNKYSDNTNQYPSHQPIPPPQNIYHPPIHYSPQPPQKASHPPPIHYSTQAPINPTNGYDHYNNQYPDNTNQWNPPPHHPIPHPNAPQNTSHPPPIHYSPQPPQTASHPPPPLHYSQPPQNSNYNYEGSEASLKRTRPYNLEIEEEEVLIKRKKLNEARLNAEDTLPILTTEFRDIIEQLKNHKTVSRQHIVPAEQLDYVIVRELTNVSKASTQIIAELLPIMLKFRAQIQQQNEIITKLLDSVDYEDDDESD